MYTVYLLKSTKFVNKSYIGFTAKTVRERLQEHNSGLSKYTNSFKPWELIYFENFSCKKCARNREMFLKSGFGYRLRKLILNNYGFLR